MEKKSGIKKIEFIISLMAVILSLQIAIIVSAAESGTLSVSKAEGKAADTVRLSVRIDSNPGIASMNLQITYDKSALELTGIASGSDFSLPLTVNLEKGYFNWSRTTNLTADGEMAVLTFQIKESTLDGVYPVRVLYADDDTGNVCNEEAAPVTLSYQDGSVTVVNHRWDTDYTVDLEPTCTEEGRKSIHCSHCDMTKDTVIIPAKGHEKTEKRNAREASCGTDGYTGDIYCTACGIKILEGTTITATGEHTYGEWTTVTEATEEANGEEQCICSFCGHIKTRVTDKLEPHTHNYEGVITKEATCAEEGLRTDTCSICGKIRTVKIPMLTTHTWDEGKVTVPATCKEAGTMTYTCSVCGETWIEEIEKLSAHTWDKGTVTKPATCKEDGVTTYTCSVCGMIKTEKIAKLSVHTWNAGTVTKKATCKGTGIKTYKCIVCGGTKTETIAKLSTHTWGAWKTISEATVFKAEQQKHICSVCGKSEQRAKGRKLAAAMKVNASKITLQKKQVTSELKVTGMAKGDYVASVKSSSAKIIKVTGFTKAGMIKLKAQNATGTTKLTITLASGLKKTVTVKVQKDTIKTTGLKVTPTKVTMKKGKKQTLKPVVTPFTSQQKVTYTSSNKAIVTVDAKGIITAKKPGTAKITVKSGGKKVTVTVKVTK